MTTPPPDDDLHERMVREALTIALPDLDPAARDTAIGGVLALMVSTADDDQGARYSMITLLATPCRHCGEAILWEPTGQDWTHFHGPPECTPAHLAAPRPELSLRRDGYRLAAATHDDEVRDATAAGRPEDTRRAHGRHVLAATLTAALDHTVHAAP